MNPNTPRRITTALAAATVVSLTTGIGPAFADDIEPGLAHSKEAVVPLVQPSIVYLTSTYSGYVWDPYLGDNGSYLDDAHGNPKLFSVTIQCSGFAVSSDGYLATAGHCVNKKDGLDLVAQEAAQWTQEIGYYGETIAIDELLDDYEVDQWDAARQKVIPNAVYRKVEASWSQSLAGTSIEKHAPARVVSAQTFNRGDGALLKVEGDGFNALPLADGDVPEINSEVITVGYPGIIEGYTDRDLVPTFNSTTISSHKSVGGGLLTVLQLSTILGRGMSGGPTVNLDGEVVGVNSSRYDGEEISNAVPVERILELMADAGVENTLSDITLTYRDGIKATIAGDKATAVEDLTEVVAEQPGNEFAAEYLARAKDLPDPAETDSTASNHNSDSVWIIVAGASLMVMLSALVVTVALRRRRNPVATSPSWTSVTDQALVNVPQATPDTGGAWNHPAAATQPVGFATPPEDTALMTLQPTAANAVRKCTGCGNPNVSERFCGHCGALNH